MAEEIAGAAERAFQRLAEMFGKKTIPYENIKGKTTVPNDYYGTWVLLKKEDGRLSVVEITGTPGASAGLRYPLGAILFEPKDFPAAADMAMHAIREYQYLHPTLPGVRHGLPAPETFLHFPQVTIEGTTLAMDDVKGEFRVVGDPTKSISFVDYEKRYFDGYRTLRIHFTGNVATMQSSHSGGYKTTNQDNALEAITFWVQTGVLKPGAEPETERERQTRGEGNILEIVREKNKISIVDNHGQSLQTDNIPKALRAIRSWVKGGML